MPRPHIASDRYNRITEIRQQDTSIESISIYTYNEQLAGYGNFLPITEDLKETEWFQQAASHLRNFLADRQTGGHLRKHLLGAELWSGS